MVNMTLIRPLNEGQGHSFWYQSIYTALISNFCFRTHRLATIHSVQTTTTDGDRQTQHCTNSATVTRSAKNYC